MALVGIEFKFPDWESRVKAAEEELNLFIAATMQTNRGMLFDQEGAYNGHERWAPLKFRIGHILKLTGALSQSMGPKNSGTAARGPDSILSIAGDEITIGTTLSYARLMNDGTVNMPGGVMRPQNGDKAFAIPIPSGAKIEKGKNYAVSRAKNEQEVRDIVANASHLKKLRKNASGKKEFAASISRLEAQISIAKSSGDKKKARALREKHGRWTKAYNDAPKDQRVIFRTSIKIPARPFDQWNEKDQAEMEEALTNKLVEILNR